MKTGIQLISDERERQLKEFNWDETHDAEHSDESLVLAAVSYALPARHHKFTTRNQQEDTSCGRGECAVFNDVKYRVPKIWPISWGANWWKPKDRITDLVKAGALIAAEIDRLQGKKSPVEPKPDRATNE